MALPIIDRLPLTGYHAWCAVRADLLRRLDRSAEAKDAYDAAIDATQNSAGRVYLARSAMSPASSRLDAHQIAEISSCYSVTRRASELTSGTAIHPSIAAVACCREEGVDASPTAAARAESDAITASNASSLDSIAVQCSSFM